MPKNVILISVDSLRADRLSCMGYRRKTTPAMDRFARDGMLYRQAYSHGSDTGNSFITLLTGVYPSAAEFWRDTPPFNPPLPAYYPYLPVAFRERGYRTGAYHCNPLISRRFGYDRGFDEYFDSLTVGEQAVKRPPIKRLKKYLRFNHPKLFRWLMSVKDIFSPQDVARVPAEGINRRAGEFLDNVDQPFFLFVHYMDVHVPYLPEPGFMKEFTGIRLSKGKTAKLNRAVFEWRTDLVKDIEDVNAMYDAQLRAFDDDLKQLLSMLKKRGLYDDSVIMLTADHGEQFLEHGSLKHDTGIFYDELLHVPMVVKGPGKDAAKGASDDLTAQIDIGPTLFDLAGLEPYPDFMGKPFGGPRQAVFSASKARDEHIVAIRTGNRKFIWNRTTDAVELYDLDADPGEKSDLSGDRAEGVEAFKAIIEDHLEKVSRTALDLKARSVGKI